MMETIDVRSTQHINAMEFVVDAPEELRFVGMIANIAHAHDQKGGRLCEEVPTLTQNSDLWSFRHDRLQTGGEALQMQGVPFYVEENQAWPIKSRAHDALRMLSRFQAKCFTGNMIHAAVAATVTFWAIGSFVTRDVSVPSQLSMPNSDDADGADDS